MQCCFIWWSPTEDKLSIALSVSYESRNENLLGMNKAKKSLFDFVQCKNYWYILYTKDCPKQNWIDGHFCSKNLVPPGGKLKNGNLFYLFAAFEAILGKELGVHLTQNKILHLLRLVPYQSVAIYQFSIFEFWISRLEAPNFWSRNGRLARIDLGRACP